MEQKIDFIINKMEKLNEVLTKQSELTNLFKCLLERTNKLEEAFDKLETQFQICEQEKLSTSFSIVGLPHFEAKDVQAITEKFFSLCGSTVSVNDFKKLFVINQKAGARIIGIFYLESTKDRVLKALRLKTKSSPVLAEHIFLNLSTTDKEGKNFIGKQVRYYTQTTEYTRRLLRQAKVYQEKFAFIWERDGRVLLRIKEGMKPIHVRSNADIQKALALV